MLDKKIQVLFFNSSSKQVVKQRRQLATSTTHLAQELLTNAQCSVGSGSFAKETRALRMRIVVASHWKLAMTNWEDHWSWSSYNYTRSCQRTQHQPFYGRSAFAQTGQRSNETAQCKACPRMLQKWARESFSGGPDSLFNPSSRQPWVGLYSFYR